MKEYPTEKVQPLGDHNPEAHCIPSQHLADYIKIPYSHFNPLQSEFAKYLEEDEMDLVVAAPTSSGKTLCAELFAARAQKVGKKALYIAPMKALADEKYDEWGEEKHCLSKYNPCILTGDFQFTDQKKKDLEESKIIVLTPEMFNSKCRSFESHPWMHNAWIIVDECHLVGMEGRGDSLEVGLIQYHENDPGTRTLMISATIPNVSDFADWLNHLSSRPAKTIVSNYRPCKLNLKFMQFDDTSHGRKCMYNEIEDRRLERATFLAMKYKDEPTLIFVGSKPFGDKLNKALKAIGIKSHFHNADLGRDSRRQIEDDFKNLKYKVLIATPTLAWGVNTPARYVICTHTKFGKTEMHPANILQEIGRAGRAGYATEGDAIILVPGTEYEIEKRRITQDYKVFSTLSKIDVMLFHVIQYIADGHIKTPQDFVTWYDKTLDAVQNTKKLNIKNAEQVFKILSARRMIKKKEDGTYEATKLGEVTTQMYMNPMDVSDMFSSFSQLRYLNPDPDAPEHVQRQVNFNVANALAKRYSYGMTMADRDEFTPVGNGYVTKRERDSSTYRLLCNKLGFDPDSYGQEVVYVKYAAVYYSMLNGEEIDQEIRPIYGAISRDIDRLITTLQRCDESYGKYLKGTKGFGWGGDWQRLKNRIKYGTDSSWGNFKGVGRVKIQKLEDAGLISPDQLKDKDNHEIAKKILGQKVFEDVLEEVF